MTDFHWARAIDGSFGDNADWSFYGVPGAGDTAILDAVGGAFTVTSVFNEAVLGVQLAANATLAVAGGTFTATAGTDGGANAGQIALTSQARLAIGGTFENQGGISLGGAGTSLYVATTATLAGFGVVRLGYDPLHPAEIGRRAGATLDNEGNTIAGRRPYRRHGGISPDQWRRRRDRGDPRQPVPRPWRDPAGVSITNHGVLEAASAVGFNSYQLDIEGATISGSGGRIVAGVYSQVSMTNCDVEGQSLSRSTTHGVIELVDSRIRLGANIDNAWDITLFHSTAKVAGEISLAGGGYVVLASGAGQGAAVVTGGPGAVLTNVDNRLFMEGSALGRGRLELVNDAGGTISGWGVIDSGSQAVVNLGLIEASHPDHFGYFKPLVIGGAIDSDGVLGGRRGQRPDRRGRRDRLGPGDHRPSELPRRLRPISPGRSARTSTFVPGRARTNFSPLETLELAHSQSYAGAITGFSKDGRTALDLRRYRLRLRRRGELQRHGEIGRADGDRRNAHGAHHPHRRLPRRELHRGERRPRRHDGEGRPRGAKAVGPGGARRATGRRTGGPHARRRRRLCRASAPTLTAPRAG